MGLLDIHAGLTYTAIAPFIGLQPTAKNPVSAECPYCKAHAWTIHKDNRNLEEWHYCSQCKVNGSVLAMAAERLNLPQEEAIHYLADKLHQNITDNALCDYRRSIAESKRLFEFWAVAKENMRKMPLSYRQVIHELGWNFPAHIDTDRIMEGPARLFGIAGPKITNKHLSQKFHIKAGAVAVLPFYKTPTQISAFACYSANQKTYISNPFVGKTGFCFGETGFVGLQFLWQMHSQTIVATSMLQQLVKLQMHNFSSSNVPLPLLGWNPGSNDVAQRPWSVLGGRRIIIWEDKPTAAVVHQAMLTDACLTFVGPEMLRQCPSKVKSIHWHQWIHHEPAVTLWNKLVRTAKPYEQALKAWARVAPISEKTKLLQDSENYSMAVAKLVRSILAPSMHSDVGRRITVPTLGKGSVNGSNGHTVIVEKNFKWYSLNSQVRWPAIVRITQIVVRANSKREFIGYMQNAKLKVPFRVFEHEATNSWLRQLGNNHGMFMQTDAGSNIFNDRKTENFNPFDAALRIEEPEIVVGLEKIGWDGSGFQFTHSRLIDGMFHQIPEFTLPKKSPGPKQNYSQLRDEVKQALKRECREMEIAWGLAVAMCAQTTAPAINLQPYGICVQRNEHDPIMKALFLRLEIDNGPYEDWPHNWPRRLDNLYKAMKFDDTGMFVTRVNPTEYKKYNQIVVLHANDNELEPRNLSHSIDKAVLHYLRHFSKQQHTPVHDWKDWLDYTFRNMLDLFSEIGSESLKNSIQRLEIL